MSGGDTSVDTVVPGGERPDSPWLAAAARNVAAMMAIQILIRAGSFLFGIYVVRHLGAPEFGRYATALAYVGMCAMLTDLGTSWLSVREIARRPEAAGRLVPDMAALRAVLAAGAVVLIPISAWALGKPPDLVVAILLASLALLLYAVQGSLDAVLVARGRPDLSSAATLVNQTVFMLGGAALLLAGAGYRGLLAAGLVGILAMTVATRRLVRRVWRGPFARPDPRRWAGLLRVSAPFGVVGAAGECAARFDTVFMSFVLSDAAVGWYAVSQNLILMTLVVGQGVAASLLPVLVRTWGAPGNAFTQTMQQAVRYAALLSLPLSLGGALLADHLVVALYGQAFAPAAPVLRIVVWALPFLFLAEILGRAAFTMGRERAAARVAVLHAVIRVTLGLVLIPRAGPVGAAVAMLAARLAETGLSSAVVGLPVLFRGNILALLRIAGAAAVSGTAVWLLRAAPGVAGLEAWLALLLAVGGGGLAFGASAVALGAVTADERRSLWASAQVRLGRG